MFSLNFVFVCIILTCTFYVYVIKGVGLTAKTVIAAVFTVLGLLTYRPTKFCKAIPSQNLRLNQKSKDK